MVEQLICDGMLFGYLCNGSVPDKTIFVTPNECQQQSGYIVYPKGSEIQRHYHNPVERHLHTTTEVLLVLKGSCFVDFYRNQELLFSRQLHVGNVLIIIDGGHGFRVIDDLVLFEVKQGPYTGPHEKVRF